MIAIKDMEMPSDCYDCPFAKNKRTNDYGSFCECGILEDYETINLYEHSKHPNCPLVEIEERKVGKWIIDIGEKEFNRERVDACHCSVCNKDPLNFVYASEDWYTYADKLPSNCPNCGCRMTKED